MYLQIQIGNGGFFIQWLGDPDFFHFLMLPPQCMTSKIDTPGKDRGGGNTLTLLFANFSFWSKAGWKIYCKNNEENAHSPFPKLP